MRDPFVCDRRFAELMVASGVVQRSSHPYMGVVALGHPLRPSAHPQQGARACHPFNMQLGNLFIVLTVQLAKHINVILKILFKSLLISYAISSRYSMQTPHVGTQNGWS
jgi:hypothetical protein